ncbi:LemA family protein [Ideonella sp.]|uniref:LemA family protein n=1 Tax=Ideonella sp. TaxID=1929293 RepID=UPI002B4791F7|nr:LemA family protein [Ideonella sp.]HJV72238.1 LemA family protein [Ideonella sp.]
METAFELPDWAPWLLQVGLAAVMLFWIVGAYNRLTRLRGTIGSAWAQIDELLARRSALLEPLAEALREPLADEATTLAALALADQHQRAAAQAVRARPAHAPALMAWVLAEAELASPLARLEALLEQRPELHGSEQVQPLQCQLAELAPRLAYARQTFSDAARAYSAATEEFPTRWVARLFGMRPTPAI